MVQIAPVILGIGCAISFIVCSFRFYLRVLVARQFSVIELAVIWAFIMQITHSVLQVKKLQVLSKPDSPEGIVKIAKMNIAGIMIYLTCLWSIKLSINLLHIQLTRKIPEVHVWAIRSLYVVVISWILMYFLTFVDCLPINRIWNGQIGRAQACPPIGKGYTFWIHTAFNIGLDIWQFCILPFPALVNIKERRLRIAVCFVYSLAGIDIAVAVTRSILIGTNWKRGLRYIIPISTTELCTTVIIGALPGISSVFARKYVYGSGATSYVSNLGKLYISQTSAPTEAENETPIELHNSGSSESTEEIIAAAA